jgi:hypothetical protein
MMKPNAANKTQLTGYNTRRNPFKIVFDCPLWRNPRVKDFGAWLSEFESENLLI